MSGREIASRVRERGGSALARRFGIDARALAAFRVALALVLLFDLLLRSFDLVAFYTDDGVLPRSVLHTQYPTLSKLSFLHTLSGDAWFQALLFLLAALVAVALLVGYRTRLVTLVSLLLLLSLQMRNPLILNAGDSLLRRLLFWGLFLPLGERWSVDAIRREGGGRTTREHVASVASAALLVQVVLVYATNGLIKTRGDRWMRGDAIRYVFGVDQLTVLFGNFLAGFPTLLVLFDRLWLAMVLSSVLLLLLTGRARALFASLFIAMHLGMALTMRLGPFPLVSMTAVIPFLPAVVWDPVERFAGRALGRRVDTTRWRTRLRPGTGETTDRRAAVRRWAGRTLPVVVSVLLAFILVWNAAALGYAKLPGDVSSTVNPSERRWDMFAPEPRTDDGWYVVPGETESGDRVDALHGSDVTWDRPPELADTFPSHRWFVYLLVVRNVNDDLKHSFGNYLCERWNRQHENDLANATAYYVEQRATLDGPEPPRRIEVVNHSCAT